VSTRATVRILGSLFGVGFVPVAPGTVASAAAALPVLAWPALFPRAILVGAAALATLASALLATRLPPKAQGGDPPWFVLDEAAGMWLAAAFLHAPTPGALLAAFLLFRLFDVLKPPPLRALERTAGPFGIVLDDLGAAGYAGLLAALLSASFAL
jgi:phosphatidylglycerophosphatase A